MYIRIPIFLDCEQSLNFFKVAEDAPCLKTRRILKEKTDCSQSTIFQVIWIFSLFPIYERFWKLVYIRDWQYLEILFKYPPGGSVLWLCR